jgi:hypothetical protein
MYANYEKRYYSPSFSEMSAVSVRRGSGGSCRLAAVPSVCSGATIKGFMVCYQVLARFTFHEEPLGSHKPGLVSTHIKKQNSRAFWVLFRLPFGHVRKARRFSKKKMARYVSFLHAAYKNRIIPLRK